MTSSNLTQFGAWLKTAKASTGYKFSKVSKQKYGEMEKWIDDFDKRASDDKIIDIYRKASESHNFPLFWSFFKNYLRFVFKDDRKRLFRIKNKMKEELEYPPVSKRDVGRKTLSLQEIAKMEEVLDNLDKYDSDNLNLLKRRKEIIKLLKHICYDTAARINEFQSIRMKDVDLENGYITLLRKRSKTRKKGISKGTLELLRSYLQGKSFNPNDKIFPLSYTQLYTSLRMLGSLSVAKSVSPHWLRYSILQHLADNGATEWQLMRFGDLENSETVKVYVQSSDIQEQKALEKHPSFKKEEVAH